MSKNHKISFSKPRNYTIANSLISNERGSLNHYGRYLSEDRIMKDKWHSLFWNKHAISIYKKEITIDDFGFNMGKIIDQMGNNAKNGERRQEAL